MYITKKLDRAVQWAGEKMGSEAKTTHTEEFRSLEAEMNLRHEGMEKLQKSLNVYVKWLSRRCDSSEDKDRDSPAGFMGRIMTIHGQDFEPDSEFGNCLVALGQSNERIAGFQDTYVNNVSSSWLDNVERSVAMMKEYAAARKKLENRRLLFDASQTKLEKARRDDYRIEEDVRVNKAKFEDSTEDVERRMQDIKDTEAENIASITEFLDAQLEYHENAAEELRRTRQAWTAGNYGSMSPRTVRPQNRSRSNTARSWQQPRQDAVFEVPEMEPEVIPRLPRRPSTRRASPPAPPQPPRPSMGRAATYEGRVGYQLPARVPSTRLTRVATDSGPYSHRGEDVFADDASTASGSGSPDWAEGSASPATSFGSLSRSTSAMALRKAPPPPPVNRAKKPAPPPPSRKISLGY